RRRDHRPGRTRPPHLLRPAASGLDTDDGRRRVVDHPRADDRRDHSGPRFLADAVDATPQGGERMIPQMILPAQTAVRRDIGFFDWFFDPDTWTGPGGILESLRDTVVLCAAVTIVAVAVSVPTAALLAHL